MKLEFGNTYMCAEGKIRVFHIGGKTIGIRSFWFYEGVNMDWTLMKRRCAIINCNGNWPLHNVECESVIEKKVNNFGKSNRGDCVFWVKRKTKLESEPNKLWPFVTTELKSVSIDQNCIVNMYMPRGK